MVLERSTFEIIAAQNPDWRVELINGEIIRKMPTQLHAYIVGIIAHLILTS
jgi:Uma2 family endonuclease